MSERTRVDIRDTTQAVTRLATAFNPPKGAKLEDIASTWSGLFADLDPAELKEATTRYLQGDHKYWPKPFDLRELALLQRSRLSGGTDAYRVWLSKGGTEGPCPVCGARLRAISRRDAGMTESDTFDLDAPVGFGVVHGYVAHQRRGGGIVGLHDGPMAMDPGDERPARDDGLRRAGA